MNKTFPSWLIYNPNNRSFATTAPTVAGRYDIEIVCVDSSQNKNYLHFALLVQPQILDKYNIYYSGIFGAVIGILTLTGLVTFSTLSLWWGLRTSSKL